MAVDNPIRKRDTGQLLGPLTTSWSMPPSCTVFIQATPTNFGIYRGQRCAIDGTTGLPQDHTDCWPPATTGAPRPAHPFFGWGIYSPGIACPTGYVTACTAEYGKRSRSGGWASIEMQYDIEPGETAVGCCPSGYECGNYNNAGTCVATISTAAQTTTVVPTGVCSGTDLVSTVLATFPDVITVTSLGTLSGTEVDTTSETMTRQATLFAPMFQLYFQQTDLPGGGSGDISDSSGGSASTSGPSTSGPGGSQKTGATEGGEGLSSAATAGIAVGAVIGGLLLVGLGFYLFMRRRKRRGAGEPSSTLGPSSELHGHDRPHVGEMESPFYSTVSSPAPYQNDKWVATEMGTGVATEMAANGEGNQLPAELPVPSPR